MSKKKSTHKELANKKVRGQGVSPELQKEAEYMPDNQIDYSDIPELTDEELKRARRVGRPKGSKPRPPT
ncbi:MAG: hypothetical protein NTZ90_15215 [Proteobacteria bacterium]|nr:hypothetical protein [Pseudomonadota bacterium]